MDKKQIVFYTASGIPFTPFAPDPKQISIVDIIHSLSNQSRYLGHTRKFYSVAQHSVILAEYMERIGYTRQQCLAALLHDAAETYFGDIPAPFTETITSYIAYRERLQLLIYNVFEVEVNPAFLREFAVLDAKIRNNEMNDLYLAPVPVGDELELGFHIIPLPPDKAENQFWNTYIRLRYEKFIRENITEDNMMIWEVIANEMSEV